MSDIAQRAMQTRSLLNPTDRSMMQQDGTFNPNMSVNDFLKQMGVDPNGPVTQLTSLWQQQSQNANPINKMQSIAGAPPAPPGGPQVGAPAAPSPGGPPPGGAPTRSLSDLLRGGMNG